MTGGSGLPGTVSGPPGITGPPGPPPGPGVQVPFGAPPSERDRRRMWIGLGVSAALLVLCCGGGALGFGTFVVQTSRSLLRQATSVVTTYLGALRDGDYSTAYNQLCTSLQSNISLGQFRVSQQGLPRVLSFTLDQPQDQGSSIVVGAEVVRESGPQSVTFDLAQQGTTLTALKICRVRQ